MEEGGNLGAWRFRVVEAGGDAFGARAAFDEGADGLDPVCVRVCGRLFAASDDRPVEVATRIKKWPWCKVNPF